jgi:hypothetical protein
MDMYLQHKNGNMVIDGPLLSSEPPGMSSSQSSADSFEQRHGMVTDWLEVWDYVGGARFRGFIAENEGERAMFVFFDKDVIGNDLKPGLTALLELCSISDFDCSRLVACLDRQSGAEETNALMRDLGWVGFEPLTLAEWTNTDDIISNRWVFLGMET